TAAWTTSARPIADAEAIHAAHREAHEPARESAGHPQPLRDGGEGPPAEASSSSRRPEEESLGGRHAGTVAGGRVARRSAGRPGAVRRRTAWRQLPSPGSAR